MKKILLFYASFGGGHLSAANSIKQCIDENFHDCETKLIDCMLYVNKPINVIKKWLNVFHGFGEIFIIIQVKVLLLELAQPRTI